MAGEGRAAGAGQGWEEVLAVAAEVGEDVFVGVQAQELAHALRRQHLGVGQLGRGAALPEARGVQPLARDLDLVVSRDKHGYNHVV